MTPTTLDALIALAAIDHADAEAIAERVTDTVATLFPPAHVGEVIGGLVLPNQEWDDKLIAVVYERVLLAIPKMLERNPERIARRVLKRAHDLSGPESKSGLFLMDHLKGEPEALFHVGRLLKVNGNELKRRDPVWLIEQATKLTDDTEALASLRRALARLDGA